MKVTLNWLRQYVDFDWSPEEVTERLTMLGLEVEGVRKLGGEFEGVVVAQVETGGAAEQVPMRKRACEAERKLPPAARIFRRCRRRPRCRRRMPCRVRTNRSSRRSGRARRRGVRRSRRWM